MRIENLRIQNFTSLIDVEIEDLPNLVVFIGKNSSGKSNILDALALLFSKFGTNRKHNLGSLDDFQHLFPNHSAEMNEAPTITVSLTMNSEEWASLLQIEKRVGELFESQHLLLQKRLENENGTIFWTTPTVSIGDYALVREGEIVEIDNDSNEDPVEIADAFADDLGIRDLDDQVRRIEANGFLNRLRESLLEAFQVIRTTESPRASSKGFQERSTIIEDQYVSELWKLSQSKGSRRQLWTRTANQFEEIAPNSQRPVGVASSVQMEEGDLTIPIGMTGEGSQAMLRLISQILRDPHIMAIEEPETHLHPGLIKQLGQLLAQITQLGKQLFICTHSPFLVERSSLDNFFVVRKQGQSTHVARMSNIEGLRNLLFDIGMKPSDVLFCDAILLVEGLSDDTFFHCLSNMLGVPLTDRHVKVVRANGYPRGRRKIEFWSEVGKDADLPLYIILDKDADSEAAMALLENKIDSERCLILSKGALEDHYPWKSLRKALSTQFSVPIPKSMQSGERVKKLRNLLEDEYGKNGWKHPLAEAVVASMTLEQAESEMGDVVSFLRKIYHEVGGA